MKYFSYDPECGFDLHHTAEEAKKAAEVSIDSYRDEAQDGWSDQVEGVCWGELKQAVVVTSREKPDPEEQSDFDEIIDYGLVDVE